MDAVARKMRVGGWRQVTLGDVLKVQHGFPFRGEFFDASGTDVLLTPKNFKRSGGLDVSDGRCKRYSGPTEKRYVLDEGDIVVAMTDLKQDAPILGSTGVVPAGGRYLHNQRIGKILVREQDRLHPHFVPWLLNSPTVREGVRTTATGATVRHTAPSRICAIRVNLPSIDGQRRIASILSAFDDLIEINERRIELLEDLARSLYREWFVHFRFPGHQDVDLVDSEVGLIPEGWEVPPVGEVFDVLGGGTPSKDRAEYWTGGSIPWFTPSDLTRSRRRFVVDSTVRITDLGLAKSSARLFPAGSVLMTSRATLGVLAISTVSATCNQGFIVIPPVPGIASAFIYEWLLSQATQLEAIATGATFREITKGAFKRVSFPLPPPALLTAFGQVLEPLDRQIAALEISCRELAATRDLLLPRLVTGRIDISDVDLGVLTPVDAE